MASETASDDFVVTRTASRSPALAVSRETAEFLMSFSAPNSLLSVVQLIAKRTSHAPEDILDEAYPHLRTFVDRGILVELGNARRVTRARQDRSVGSRAPDQRFRQFVSFSSPRTTPDNSAPLSLSGKNQLGARLNANGLGCNSQETISPLKFWIMVHRRRGRILSRNGNRVQSLRTRSRNYERRRIPGRPSCAWR